jgi:hypothetical protein
MTSMTCPNCHCTLAVTVASAPANALSLPIGRTVGPVLATVAKFAEGLSGRYTSAELRDRYEVARGEHGWPELSPKALGRALAANGWRPWRTKSDRGWER